MALINLKSYYANKINSLQETLTAKKDLLIFTKKLLTENNNEKYNKKEYVLNKAIVKEEARIANINDEVNKNLARKMLKYTFRLMLM